LRAPIRPRRSLVHLDVGRKTIVFAVGAVGLAAALTTASLVAPDRANAAAPTYVPAVDREVIAHVPARDPHEVAERAQLAAAPERVELAVELARADLARARALHDPRYLGRAQATLGRWWKLADPPADVLLVRATIEQSLHDFPAARVDLDRLVARRPDDAQAHLVRATVATVTGDYAAARASCDAVATLAPALVVASCRAPLDGVADPDGAYDQLARAVASSRRAPASVRSWALATLAELAIQRGDEHAAATHLRAALALDDGDAYARAALADVLLATGDPRAASELTAGFDQIDNLLVRRAIAEHRAHGRDAGALARAMHDRIAAAAERGDRLHVREQAMFVLAVDGDARAALALALENWNVQKELADARLLVACAAAARDRAAAEPVLAWARDNHVVDARLRHASEELP
jgi:predicted Zn-dependent protease